MPAFPHLPGCSLSLISNSLVPRYGALPPLEFEKPEFEKLTSSCLLDSTVVR
jgi:hypothetical protein